MANIKDPNSILITRIRDIDEKILEKLGKEALFVNKSQAFYSWLMRDAQDEYRCYLESMNIHQQPLSISLANMVSE